MKRSSPYRFSGLGILIVVFSLFGCMRPFVQACREVATDPDGDWKYTEIQAAVGCDRAQFYAYPHIVTFDKEKNIWRLNPNGVLTEDLKAVLEDEAKSLNAFLSYKNREDANFIDWFIGFRAGLEKEEAIVQYLIKRLDYVQAYNQFTDLVGEPSSAYQSESVKKFFPADRKLYSMRIIYPRLNIEEVPFIAEYLETARKDGSLKLADSFEVNSSQEFAKKVPNLYDPNEYTWEKEKRGWLIKSYKVVGDKEKPVDNVVHYIEILRRRNNSSDFETKPAVRGFMTNGGSRVTVFVIDYDREGELGYGSPDAIMRTFADITTGKDIFTDRTLRERLLESIYFREANIKDRPERKKPKDREIYVSIVKMGEAPLDVWEKGDWTVPFEYNNLNQNLEIEYSIPKTPEEKHLAEKEKLRQVQSLRRVFKQNGTTVLIERWLPKEEYAKRNITYAFAAMDTLTIRRKGLQEEKGELENFAATLKVIDYQFGGKWFRIIDENGNGTFEKRRIISDPTLNSNNNQNLVY